MRALVTGSAGFAGRHYVRALTDRGYHITDVDIADTDGIDARDFFRHSGLQYDLVIHCAAIVGGRATIDGSPLALAPNLELDSALFQWAERTRPGRVVYISSSAAYPVSMQGAGRALKLSEEDIDLACPELPDQLYGWAKLTGEMLASRYSGKVTVIRPFSGYGEDQDDCYPFRAFAERAKAREDPFTVWGTGHQVRDFIHIDDIVAATLALADDGVRGPVNLGTGRPVSMLELARMMCEAAGYRPVMSPTSGKPSGVQYRVADVRNMREHFEPLISLEEGVKRAVAA